VTPHATDGADDFARPFLVADGRRFRLADHDPRNRAGLKDKEEAQSALREGVERLAELQDMLYAQDRWAVLLIFQAMDAAGKDSVIKHVMSGVNPQGCDVHSFKAPSAEELDHDYMWRCLTRLPGRGKIGIFNRSYYEETLVVRVHEEILRAQKLPPELVTPRVWEDRFEDINAVERYLTRNGVVIRKFFLNVSRKEQKKRFLERLEEPEKHWKFEARDVREREHWDEYRQAYEEMIRHTSTPHAPWYVVPADTKWVTRLVVAAAVVDALQDLALRYPVVDKEARRELAEARRALLEENGAAGDDDEAGLATYGDD
jgi:PPK2 family polyphosphate:nucleotide phosphotransferase